MTTLREQAVTDRHARRRAARLAAPEFLTAMLLILTFTVCAAVIPRFLDAVYLLDRASLYLDVAIMALGMTFVIVAGHIDLSCASILALAAAASAYVHAELGVPIALAVCAAPMLGAALGGLNGLIVARLGMPSLVATLATMAIYRGLAQVLLGDHSLPLPKQVVGVERYAFAGTHVPVVLVAFIALSIVLGLLLHRTVFGRWVFAIGTNAQAARYSGVPVGGATLAVFVLSGMLAGLAGLTMSSRLGVARYDHALGMELDVVTAVVLGGASIYGGRGTILGTVMAVALIAAIQTGMGVANVKAEYQQTVSGALLIVAVLLSNLIARLRG